MQTIGESAFSDCSNLESLVIPNSVKTIGEDAFANCMNLYSVTSLINMPFKLNESAFRYTAAYSHVWDFFALSLEFVPLHLSVYITTARNCAGVITCTEDSIPLISRSGLGLVGSVFGHRCLRPRGDLHAQDGEGWR